MFLFTNSVLNIGLTIVLVIIFVLLSYFVNKTINKNPDEIKKGFLWYYLFLFLFLLIFVGVSLWSFDIDPFALLLDLWDKLVSLMTDSIGSIIGTVITIFVSVIIIKLVNILIKRASQKEGPNQKRITTIMKVVKSIIRYAIYIVGIIVILALWGVNVLPALAGLGILGIVVGLGAQSLIQDFIAGFFIIFEHHFDVGDIVEVDSFKGEVIDIGLKTTRIRNWKQDIKIISNGSISDITNYSKSPSVAIIKVGIGYGEDIQKTIDILKKELPKYREVYPEITEDPVVLGVTELADNSVNITVIVRTKTEQHYGVERGIRQGIKELLDKNNIEIPFPQMVLHKPE